MISKKASIAITYDREVDALALELNPNAKTARIIKAAPGINLDFDKDGKLVTIEVLEASTHVNQDALMRLPTGEEQITLAEASALSGLAQSTLRVQVNAGRIAAQKQGRDWVLNVTDLFSYLDSRDSRGRPPAQRSARKQRNNEVGTKARKRKTA